MDRLKIAFLLPDIDSSRNQLDRYIQKMLEAQGHRVVLYNTHVEPTLIRWVIKIKNRLLKKIFKKRVLADRDILLLKARGRQFSRIFARENFDCILSLGSLALAYIKTEIPLVFWTDATFHSMLNFYPEFSGLSRTVISQGDEVEQDVLYRCRLAIFTSDWAAESAISHYHALPEKVVVLPFGANLDRNISRSELVDRIKLRPMRPVKLLFWGADFKRKGGEFACRVVEEMNHRGIGTHLIIAGSMPILPEPVMEYIKPVGFLDKTQNPQSARIEEIMSEAHFLILPTRADATPHAINEANAFGLPCLASDVGGMSTIIKNGVNGQLFPLDARVEDYCDYLERNISENNYPILAQRTLQEYESRLSWEAVGKEFTRIIDEKTSWA